ncbi:MAG TPA: endolytic transglycosylase MltG [Bryobacteraceae bacterium]|nr:endolytic transglycosylase MltG [Bryobacteraceae bacterium]
MGKAVKAFAVLLFVVLLGIAGYAYLGPYTAPHDQTFVEIEHGTSSRQIAEVLAEQGLVRSSWAFLAIRVLHPTAKLQAGEYRFSESQTPWEIFNKISRGQVFFELLTVPEGSNTFDIAALLEHSVTAGAIHPGDFLKAAADPTAIRDLDPGAPDLEGYLFPSTYRITHTTTATQLCQMMTAEFRKQWQLLSATGGHPDPHRDLHQVVTLASLVEKESALAPERPMIAGVFLNRLRLEMPLQCDPTTAYAALLENRYRGVIGKSDLASPNRYNTYTHTGLPPGPIANPGAQSLAAALHPATVAYLYFVAKPDNSGSHHFSATLAEHNLAVERYRKISR